MSADPITRYGPERAVLLTNDDGIHPEDALILPLAQTLVANGHNVIVVAPGQNNSACSQRITLGRPLTLRRHPEYEKRYGHAEKNGTIKGILKVFSVDKGTPADCIITAIEPHTGLLAKLGVYPCLTLSGVNYGQNMGSDVLYSGTFAGARQAAMYGIPAVASSVDLHKRDSSVTSQKKVFARAIAATVEMTEVLLKSLPRVPPDMGRLNPEAALSSRTIARNKTRSINERVRDAFARGDVVFNINVPKVWNEKYEMTRLDSLLYRSVVQLEYVPSGEDGHAEDTVGIKMWSASPDGMFSKGSDLDAVRRGYTSVTAVGTWPYPHPLAISEQLLNDVVQDGVDWIPKNSAVLQKDMTMNNL
ncbi:Survival protein SurE [Gracilaria domingensis]|nr:Survival protein SurE [Gracilaria domingensis]